MNQIESGRNLFAHGKLNCTERTGRSERGWKALRGLRRKQLDGDVVWTDSQKCSTLQSKRPWGSQPK